MVFHPLIVAILRAAHCRSTHHYFAIDALPLVQTDPGRRLVRLLLGNHQRYLTGAIDPDVRFRDFQNHVIHVSEGYWGGAPRVAHQWYDRLQRYLRLNRFSDAAHAAGVLSHYFTDPMQPLHTQHGEQEKILHRPIEWSVYRSYDEILQCWQQDDLRIVFQLSDGPAWLGEAMMQGARLANRKYGRLLEQFDLSRSVQNPRSGLNSAARESMSEMFGLAITGWARVLERAAADAEATRSKPLPWGGLAMPCLLATLQVPLRLWMARIQTREEQQAVSRLVDEVLRTGELREHIPAEVDIVHRVTHIYRAEQRWKQERALRSAASATVVQIQRSDEQDPALDDGPRLVPFPSRPSDRRSRANIPVRRRRSA